MTTPARSGRGVLVVPWPSAAAARARARLAGAPCLLVVDDGAAPPTDCALDEDWTTSATPARDVAARIATLAARPAGQRWLDQGAVGALPDEAVALLDVLVQRRPRATPLGVVRDVIGPPHDVDATLRGVRSALRPAGYDVLAVPGGVLLAGVNAGLGATANAAPTSAARA
jgi:hypothetical protein